MHWGPTILFSRILHCERSSCKTMYTFFTSHPPWHHWFNHLVKKSLPKVQHDKTCDQKLMHTHLHLSWPNMSINQPEYLWGEVKVFKKCQSDSRCHTVVRHNDVFWEGREAQAMKHSLPLQISPPVHTELDSTSSNKLCPCSTLTF